MEFIKVNPHPKNRKVGDCVLRAIVSIDGRKWLDVYDDLCAIGREELELPNAKTTYEKYLETHGYTKFKMPKHSNGKRYTVRQFAEENNKGSFYVTVANHCCAVVDGNLYDLWNCGAKSVCNYYKKN